MSFENKKSNFQRKFSCFPKPLKFCKKAVIGGSIMTFVITIAIILLLIVYAVIGVIIKTIRGAPKEVNSKLEESEKLKKEFDGYFSNFEKLTQIRKFFWIQKMSLEGAKQRAGWEGAS